MPLMHPLEEKGQTNRISDPCILVIFGATGDLTARKLVPAIYNLMRDGQLPAQFACVGFARRPKTHDQFREEMKTAIAEFSRTKPIDDSLWAHFKDHIFYHQSEFHEEEGYKRLGAFLGELDAKLGTKGNRVFYLSTQPSFFPLIASLLHKTGLVYKDEDPWSRVIIEKPFGHDLNSAISLQKELLNYLTEDQIYRIDHYLGKETVQNLMVFRFANLIFESLWNNRYIDHIQITVAEEIGIGTRGKFFEEAGLMRDIVQNHMMQILSLMAMEPPASLSAGAVHNEKVKVLQAIRPIDPKDAVRGQYGPGFIGGKAALGYRQEKDVSPNSIVETYVALPLFIDNPRWSGVPFFLRGGKRLPKRATEIAVTFKDAAGSLFQNLGRKNEPNVLAIRIQPDEGSSLKINCKVPATPLIQPVKMDFRYGSYFGLAPPEAYERLICDCILGDSTLFAREDEVLSSWKLITPILEYWASNKAEFPNYDCGTWGPQAADAMIGKEGRKWRLI